MVMVMMVILKVVVMVIMGMLLMLNVVVVMEINTDSLYGRKCVGSRYLLNDDDDD